MSRIGKQPIALPKGVTATINAQTISVKGPKGSLSRTVNPTVSFRQEGDQLHVVRAADDRQSRAEHGLYRALVAGMVKGVSEGFKKTLEISGVGFRAEVKGKTINFQLGFTHPVDFPLPDGVTAAIEGPKVILTGADKEVVGRTAAKIRALRIPDPYKLKGIKYEGERIIQKAGKKAGS
ncbi:MAG: 50S ribosomal protein L6 [Myxococcota bacterium]|nr:50S ribosomal protein L6 [Myxococcota bacterium]